MVAEMTGYPPDLLDPDLDLEADLGVDTVKQAEVFAAVREHFGIERDDTVQLRDFPTLIHVVGWVRATAGPAPTAAAPRRPRRRGTGRRPGRGSRGDRSRTRCWSMVLSVVAEMTGYPPTCSTRTWTWRPTSASTRSSRPRSSPPSGSSSGIERDDTSSCATSRR